MTSARKSVLVLCPYPQGVAAGQRLKYEQHIRSWEAAGYDVTISSFMDMKLWEKAYEPGHIATKFFGVLRGHARRLLDLLRVSHFDIVYVFMWVTPVGTSLLERLVRRLAKALVYDIEDNILAARPPGSKDGPTLGQRLLRGTGKARFLVRTADHVISASPFLNENYLAINEKRACSYIPPSIDTDRFQPVTSYVNDGPVTIGWTGTFSSRVYLDLLADVFRRLAERVQFRLKVIGNFDYDLPGINVEVVRWSAEREVEDLQSLDIGVYPLATDDWVLGKAGLKAMQYMAVGLPCVATAVSTTPLVVQDQENGLLVMTDDEWVDALERLAKDPELRGRLGRKARQDTVARFSKQAVSGRYLAVLSSVSGVRR